MTLVIAKEDAHHVIMGADSAVGSPEESYVYSHLAKIALCGAYLVAACGSLRVGQVLHHCVEWPEPPKTGDLLPFLVHDVVPEIRRAVQDAGLEPRGPLFLGDKTVLLVGVRGELYTFGSDLAVCRCNRWACIGCGRHAAYPVMEALQLSGVGSAREQIELTLEIVSRHVPVVEPPFRFFELPAEPGVEPPSQDEGPP